MDKEKFFNNIADKYEELSNDIESMEKIVLSLSEEELSKNSKHIQNIIKKLESIKKIIGSK